MRLLRPKARRLWKRGWRILRVREARISKCDLSFAVSEYSQRKELRTLTMSTLEIRKECTNDAVQIHKLVNAYAKQEVMLPRTLLSIYENIRDFYVAVEDGRVLG